MATTAGPKHGFQCDKALLSLCSRCPCLVERSRAGVLAELWMEGCNTPALAPPSAACTRKSGSFDACTMSTLSCAQIDPGRTWDRLSEIQGRAFIRAQAQPLEYSEHC